jgi:glycosyltransferase involved in cell wall biosynthesis
MDRVTVIGSISSSPFIESDVNLLKKLCNVYTVDIDSSLAKTTSARIFQYLRIGSTILFNACPKILLSDSVFIWFADVHAVIPILLCKILRKNCVISIGGFEVCNMPDINYGMMREPIGIRGKLCKWVMRNASTCIVPSQSYYDRTLPYVSSEEKIYKIPDCVTCDIPLTLRFYNKRRKVVLMVGQATESSYLLKGIPYYNEAANQMHDTTFYLIGRYDENIKSKYKNICYLGALSHEEVFYWMDMTKVYCQLSKTESFGVSVLEAMSHGCIPVVTNVDNIQLLTGGHGYVVDDKYPMTIIEGIQSALSDSCFELHMKISHDTMGRIKTFCKIREYGFKELFGL